MKELFKIQLLVLSGEALITLLSPDGCGLPQAGVLFLVRP